MLSKKRFNSLVLFALLIALLITGCTLSDGNADITKETMNEEVMELATVWAEALQTRNGEPRYEMMSEEMKAKFEQEQIERGGEEWNFNIGDSSPWVIDFDIELEGMIATINYALETSESADYAMSETIIFEQDNGKLIVVDTVP